MVDAFFNTPVGMVVYGVTVFVGLNAAIWGFGYLVARIVESWLDH